MNRTQTVILAGGYGTRLSKVFPGTPKPLIPVNGIPILERIVNECKKYNQKDILLLTHFKANKIRNYFGDGKKFGVSISYFEEEHPMGTGGALLLAKHLLEKTFLVLYADVYFDLNLDLFKRFHNENSAELSMVIHPNNHPYDSDLVVLGKNNKVIDIKPALDNTKFNYRNLVNAAMYIMDKSILDIPYSKNEKYDIAKDFIPTILKNNKKIFAYRTVEYLKDMGTPDRLRHVEEDIKSGVVSSRSNITSRKALFIDRDGTIIEDCNHLSNPKKVRLLDGASDALKKINKSDYLSICMTNQPVVARGECSLETLDKIHAKMDHLLGLDESYLDDLYFCPHHPHKGFDREIASLKRNCHCRKPKIGMIKKAEKDHNISLSDSWMIGDRTSDLQTGNNFGGYNSLILTGEAGRDKTFKIRPDLVSENLDEAVSFILDSFEFFDKASREIIKNLKKRHFIFIGGCSRSGKSTLSSILKKNLKRESKMAHILELDGHLFGNRSSQQDFKERYNIKEILKILDKFAQKKTGYYHDKSFDHFQNCVVDHGKKKFNESDIFIIEGIVSLEIAKSFESSNFKVFVDAPLSLRKKNFINKYRRHNYEMKGINKLWKERKASEDEYLLKEKRKVDYVFSNIK